MTENTIREALLLGRSFVELAEEDLGRDCSKSLKQIDEALALLSQSSPSGGGMMCPPSMPEASPRESGVSGQQHAAMLKDERLFWFLTILNAMGGHSDASDNRNSWLEAFCMDRPHDPDTYNLSERLGLSYSTHDTSLDTSTVFITQKGKAWLDCVSDEQPKAEDTNVAEPAGCQRGGAAETPSNQSLQEGMVLVPREPTRAMLAALGNYKDPSRMTEPAKAMIEICYQAMLAASPSSISQEQEKGNA